MAHGVVSDVIVREWPAVSENFPPIVSKSKANYAKKPAPVWSTRRIEIVPSLLSIVRAAIF